MIEFKTSLAAKRKKEINFYKFIDGYILYHMPIHLYEYIPNISMSAVVQNSHKSHDDICVNHKLVLNFNIKILM